MEGGTRRTRALKENKFGARDKINGSSKGQSTAVRGALKEVAPNILDQEQSNSCDGKDEQQKTSKRKTRKCNTKRCEESTGGLTTCATLETEAAAKAAFKKKAAKTTVTYIDNVESSPTLPDDIDEIDAGNGISPLTYVKEIYSYLSELECKYRIEENHLKNQTEITGKMRASLINWLVDLQTQFNLLLDTFQLTVGIVDRYLQVVPNVPQGKLQLIGVSALFIASKYEETYGITANEVAAATEYACRETDILIYEKKILMKLGFCLAWPTPISFLRRFTKAAHGTLKHHHLAEYFVDLCLVDESMTHYLPSELSAAAICLSLYTLSLTEDTLKDLWTPSLLYYTGYSLEAIEPIIMKIAQIVKNKDKIKFKAVTKKYKKVVFDKVSGLRQLKSEAMYDLAGKAST